MRSCTGSSSSTHASAALNHESRNICSKSRFGPPPSAWAFDRVGMVRWIASCVLSVCLTACGRVDFDPIGGGGGAAALPRTIAAGQGFTCALRNGTLACWGDNASGQLGNGTTLRRTTPIPVALADIVEVDAGA